jgi:3-dehydroquinate dehydratase/shikimate dehydrogenase
MRGKICLVLAEKTLEADLRHVESHRGRIDLVELRADHLADEEKASAGRLPARVGLPVILTIRRRRDGGIYDGPETERVKLLGRLVGQGFAYVDIEEDLKASAVEARIRECGARVVRSLHDFAGVPPELVRRLSVLARRPDEIPKAAVTPKTCAQLADFLAACAGLGQRERVLLGMGDIGFPTRVLAPLLGSSWCYASPTDHAVAPGQVTPSTLEEVYRYRSITPSTLVMGIIGNPVMHSRSPLIHNRAFTALGIDAVYVPFQVPDLQGFWKVADSLAVRGLSVTAPHKEAVLGGPVRGDEQVRVIGACNTLLRPAGRGGWDATNTDGEGFLAPLRAAFGGALPSGLGATVIGAGGAARSVVAALTGAGVRVLVLNRTTERARALAAIFAAQAGGMDVAGFQAARGYSDLIVQTTSAGMTPREDEDPAPGLGFRAGQVVYELVYAPEETPFVRRAQEAGSKVIYGRQMLMAQAMHQFKLFTGKEYPPDLVD